MQAPENFFMPEAPPKSPSEPGPGLFAVGIVLGAFGTPILLRWLSPETSGLPGISGGAVAYGIYVLVLLLAGSVALACFALGRAVRRQRRHPRQRFVPRYTYVVVGFLVPTVFVLVTRCTDWGDRIVGLHWALAIGIPFCLGLYTAPRCTTGERPEAGGVEAGDDTPAPAANLRECPSDEES